MTDPKLTDVIDPATGKVRMTPERRAALRKKYPALADESEPQATDRATTTYDHRDPRDRRRWALRQKFPALQQD